MGNETNLSGPGSSGARHDDYEDINDAAWRVPIYFAVTVSQQNRIGLDNFLDMQGLTFQLKSHRTSQLILKKCMRT